MTGFDPSQRTSAYACSSQIDLVNIAGKNVDLAATMKMSSTPGLPAGI